jgi:DNA-binding CsgD family transcriptional regulator
MIRPVRADGTIETGGVFVPIARPRVTQRVASAAMQRVVLIVAPAGYGKSVALRQYLDAVADTHIRFDVLPDNAALLGFLRGFADAIAHVAPDARATLPGAYEKNAESENAGSDLALWMYSHLKEFSGTIAIDDLHVAQDNREVTRFLSSLIERSKGNIQWIIASRSTQGLPIGTWLAYGESDLAIDEHDLKFSVEEAKDAARSFRLGVRDDELYELLNLTDGWATAMTFALRSSTRSVDLRSIKSMTREMIYRYLAEQVYGTLSGEERAFLETAALLPEIDVGVLVAAGYDRATPLLEELRQRVAFIQEPSRGHYRLHDLFREFVLYQRDLRGEVEARALALNVGAALERLGRVVPALRLYVENHDAESVKRVLEEHGLMLMTTGFADDVEATLTADLGDAFLKDATVVGLRGCIELLHGRFDEGERSIARSLTRLAASPLKGELLLRMAISRVNSGALPIDLLREAIDAGGLDATVKLEVTALLAVCLARSGRSAEAADTAQLVAAELEHVVDEAASARLLLRLSSVHFSQAEYRLAQPQLEQAALLGISSGLWSVVSKANLSLSLCALFSEDDPTRSLRYAHEAAKAATRAGDYFDLQGSLLMILGLETRRGSAERVAIVEKQLAELRSNEGQRARFIVSSQAHRHAWAGRFADAHRLFGSILDRQTQAADRALVFAIHALCLALDGHAKSSGPSVERALQIVDMGDAAGEGVSASQFEIAVLFATIAEVVAGRFTSATRIFKRYPSTNELTTNAMRAIAEKIIRAGRSPQVVIDDVEPDLEVMRGRGYGGYAQHVAHAIAHVRARPGPEGEVILTPSEAHVIRCLAAGLKPKDIAAEMGRSVQTVQTHVKRAIEKLGCHGRDEAIAVARQLGLLRTSV